MADGPAGGRPARPDRPNEFWLAWQGDGMTEDVHDLPTRTMSLEIGQGYLLYQFKQNFVIIGTLR